MHNVAVIRWHPLTPQCALTALPLKYMGNVLPPHGSASKLHILVIETGTPFTLIVRFLSYINRVSVAIGLLEQE